MNSEPPSTESQGFHGHSLPQGSGTISEDFVPQSRSLGEQNRLLRKKKSRQEAAAKRQAQQSREAQAYWRNLHPHQDYEVPREATRSHHIDAAALEKESTEQRRRAEEEHKRAEEERHQREYKVIRAAALAEAARQGAEMERERSEMKRQQEAKESQRLECERRQREDEEEEENERQQMEEERRRQELETRQEADLAEANRRDAENERQRQETDRRHHQTVHHNAGRSVRRVSQEQTCVPSTVSTPIDQEWEDKAEEIRRAKVQGDFGNLARLIREAGLMNQHKVDLVKQELKRQELETKARESVKEPARRSGRSRRVNHT